MLLDLYSHIFTLGKELHNLPKIAFLLNHLNQGGAERVVVSIANYLSERGFSVSVILTRAEGSYLNDLQSDVKVIKTTGGRMIYALPSLIRILRKNKFDCVISGLDQPNVALGLIRPFVSRRTKFIATEHNHPLASRHSVRGIVWKIVNAVKPLLYRSFDHIIAVSQESALCLVDDFNCDKDKVSAIYNPVPIEEVRKKSQLEPTHPWLRSKNSAVFVAAGRLVPAKDYENLLHAFKLVVSSVPAKLIIFGEGYLRENLSGMIRDLNLTEFVSLAGFSNNVYPEIAASDCFVMSSRNEGLPTVLIEAMCCGVNVVSTDCPSGPKEIIRNEDCGWLVPMQNNQALAAAMVEALSSKKDPSFIFDEVKRFSPDTTGNNYAELITRLVGEK